LAKGEVAVVAGFQGVATGRITTLGRGGSDTSAVAMAAAIKADRCDIYTDVDGVYTTDPRIVPKARKLDKIAFEEMLEMASLGAKVLQTRSVELAMVHRVPHLRALELRQARGHRLGTPRNADLRRGRDRGTAGRHRHRLFQGRGQDLAPRVPDKPGVAAAIFGPLAEAGINVDMIVQNVSADGKTTDLTFTVPAASCNRALAPSKDHAMIDPQRTRQGLDHRLPCAPSTARPMSPRSR
jgi:aspartate kinase